MTDPRGDYCDWAYCSKWADIVVERDVDGAVERRWVCLTHEVHAHIRGWRQVWPEPQA